MKKLAFYLLFLLYGISGWSQSASLQFDGKWLSSLDKPSLFPRIITAGQSRQELPKAWCYTDLALFCKLEVKMEKAARFPIKFRLGDVPYVDRLEGKRTGF